MSGHPWPLFDLRIRTPRLELRLPTDADLVDLAAAARSGITEPDQIAFLVPWHQLPSPALERQFLLHWWQARGTWSPSRWSLGLAVIIDGKAVGMQDIMAKDFAITRAVTSGSWLARDFHGHGYGTEMRGGMLALAFDGLGAESAESGYLGGNRPSEGVSRKLGYVPNGESVLAVEGRRAVEQRLRVTRDQWKRDLVPATIEGLEPCLKLFGIGELGPDEWATF
jgi:RimJ/RimL family protein N-acetyltransferase